MVYTNLTMLIYLVRQNVFTVGNLKKLIRFLKERENVFHYREKKKKY